MTASRIMGCAYMELNSANDNEIVQAIIADGWGYSIIPIRGNQKESVYVN